MYSRVTLLEIDTVRIDVDEAVELFGAGRCPGCASSDGYEGAVVLATPEGKGLILSFWETEEAADASAGFADRRSSSGYVTLFAAPPGREHYEVAFADLPGVPAARAWRSSSASRSATLLVVLAGRARRGRSASSRVLAAAQPVLVSSASATSAAAAAAPR